MNNLNSIAGAVVDGARRTEAYQTVHAFHADMDWDQPTDAECDRHWASASLGCSCYGDECMICGLMWCGEPLHFHHDGCPALTECRDASPRVEATTTVAVVSM